MALFAFDAYQAIMSFGNGFDESSADSRAAWRCGDCLRSEKRTFDVRRDAGAIILDLDQHEATIRKFTRSLDSQSDGDMKSIGGDLDLLLFHGIADRKKRVVDEIENGATDEASVDGYQPDRLRLDEDDLYAAILCNGAQASQSLFQKA